MKLHRSALMAGLLALGVAACGDDVQVVEPPVEVPTLVATMAPSAATVAVGNNADFAVNVSGGAQGETATWTCASSNTGIASVTTTATGCTATGIAVGGSTITAVVTKGDQTANVGANLTVTDDASAVVTINSINQGGIPAVSPFAGQLDVVINVERGDQVLSQLDLLVDGDVVASQTFASTAAPVEDPEAQAIQTITLSFNTAKYDPVTGAVEFLNGDRVISAQLFVVGGSTPIASNTIAVVFLNADGYHVTADLGDNTAIDGNGIQWWGGPDNGDITISVLPVNYSGRTTQSVTVAYCAAAPVVDSASPFDFTFSGVGLGACVGYSTAGGAAPPAFVAADAPIITSVQDGVAGPVVNMFAMPTPTNPLNTDHPFPAPIDFLGPGAPQFAANPNGRQNGWINAAVGLTGSNTSATDDDWIINGAADTGVGGYNRWLRSDDTAPATVDAALAATPEADPALPDPTVNNDDICFIASAADDLGNESALPAATTTCLSPPFPSWVATGSTHLRGGVDIMNPTIDWTAASLAANSRIWNGNVANEFQFTVADLGAVGNSGMLSGSPVTARVQTRSAAATVCGDGGATLPGIVVMGVCTSDATGLAVGLPLVTTTGVAAQTTAAYYTIWAESHDAAGNSSGEISRVVARDNSPVVATAPAVPVTITGPFLASSFLNDDLSIMEYYWQAGFTTALMAPATVRLASAATPVDGFDAASLTNTNFAVNTTVNTFLGLQGPAAAYAAGTNPLSSVALFAADQTQTALSPPHPFAGPGYSTSGPAAVNPTAPTTGVVVANAAPAWTFNSYTLATSNATICALVVTTAGTCPVSTTSTTFTAVATGTTATFPNPFSRVDFYTADAPGADLRLVASVPAGAATLVDNGATRVWTYSLTVTGAAHYAAIEGDGVTDYAVNVYALGVNAAGDVAMVSPVVVQNVDSGTP